MCEPTTMMVAQSGMAAGQMVMGINAGQAQADQAAAAAQAGYQGAMEQYDRENEYLNQVEEYKWSEYRKQQDYRTKMVNAEFARFEATAQAINEDASSKYTALMAGSQQLMDSTKMQMEEGWANFRKGNSTRRMNALSRGVEGASVDAQIGEAQRAMYMAETKALEAIAWDAEQKVRQARSIEAQTKGALNQALPRPIAHVALPQPGQMRPAMPSAHAFHLQAHAGYVQGHNQVMNSVMEGAGTAMQGFGNYYSQTTPPGGGKISADTGAFGMSGIPWAPTGGSGIMGPPRPR